MWYSTSMKEKTIILSEQSSLVLQYSLLALSFFLPFFISGPQLLTGTLVNALLFLYAFQFGSKKSLPIVILPSIGALLNGVLLGKFTFFLFYFLPFIWVGNYVLVQSFILLRNKDSDLISFVGSSTVKFLVLFIASSLYVFLKIVPPLFAQSMGFIQLYTALIGGAVAFFIHTIIQKK